MWRVTWQASYVRAYRSLFHLTQEMRVYNANDDVAKSICQALFLHLTQDTRF